jgi:hypothetical protein
MSRLGVIALLAAVALPIWAQAQIGARGNSGTGMHLAGPPAGRGLGVTIGIARTPPPNLPFNHPFQPAIFLGTPWFADYEPVTVPPQVLPVIVVQTQPAAEPPPEEIKPAVPLLIEWQGDRYVRFSGTDMRGAEAKADYVEAASVTVHASRRQPRELPPAALVFRDGHREEVRDYAIVRNVIYARGNYWSDGYWTRAIPISDLNLPATVRANDERGIRFTMPAGPNEVVTRP